MSSTSAIENWQVAVAAGVSAIAVAVSIHRQNSMDSVEVKSPRYGLRPADVTWLSDSGYEQLSALCDTIIPAHENVADEEVISLLNKYLGSNSLLPVLDEPALVFLQEGALSAGIPSAVSRAIDKCLYPEEKTQLSILCSTLSTSVGCLLLTGYAAPFGSLSLECREKGVYAMRDSMLSPLRAAYTTFKRLTGNLFLSFTEPGRGEKEDQARLAWCATMKHQPGAVRAQKPLLTDARPDAKAAAGRTWAEVDKSCRNGFGEIEFICDVVIIGSGAGGGMAASELVQKGLDVIVLEKGGYYRADDFARWNEPEAMEKMYEKGGMCSTVDGSITILAGACVGGGTTVNWSASFRTPDHVRREWAAQSPDMSQFADDGAFEKSLDATCKALGVSDRFSHRRDPPPPGREFPSGYVGGSIVTDTGSASHPPNTDSSHKVNLTNEMLWIGAERTGEVPGCVPRNCAGCVDCGQCSHGCVFHSKRSTATTLLEPLLDIEELGERVGSGSGTSSAGRAGTPPTESSKGKLRLLFNAHADRSLVEDGRAVGVLGTVTDRDEKTGAVVASTPVRVRAVAVVSAGGSLHSPAFLLRSGLRHDKIGRHLTLHPVMCVAGFYGTLNTGLDRGVSMGVVVHDPRMPTRAAPAAPSAPPFHGCAIETPPVQPGLWAIALPWLSGGLGFKALSLVYRSSAPFIFISRDSSSGENRVVLNADGQPVIHYKVTPRDEALLMTGLERMLRMQRAAGASACFVASEREDCIFNEMGNEDAFEAFITGHKKRGVVPNSTTIFSAHQMSSCRMSADPKNGAIRPSGETWEVSGLFVADGSVLPTSLGINPMITIEAMAHMISANIAKYVHTIKEVVSPRPAHLHEKSKL
jgi:choline dehydrogenase-like flavoprotein